MPNNETQADIAREMRTYFQAKKRGNPEHRPWHLVLSDWADRIEAAYARDIGDIAALRAALEEMLDECCNLCDVPNQMSESGQACNWRNRWSGCQSKAIDKARAALAAPARKGKWKNGTDYEYEYAYCSECGRMQWAGWDTHKQAEENIESFADNYRYCPGCGAKMEGGVYVK